MAPIIKNVNSHPQCEAIHGTVSGASKAPIFEPELKIPVAKERSFLGKYSAVALIAAGKFPDSPNPKTALAIINPRTDTDMVENPISVANGLNKAPRFSAYAWIIAPTDQMIKAIAKPHLVPRRSIKRPANNIEIA